MNKIEIKLVLATTAVTALLVPHAALWAAPAARVEFTVGNPELVATGGQTRSLQKGAPIEPGDLVSTNDGRVQLRFTDGAYVSLQPRTQFRVDEYRWEGKADGSERGFFSLLKGGLRTITGIVGRTNKRNYQVNTSVATIGIRGTEYKIAEFGDGIIGSVGEGSINVCSGAGCAPFVSGEAFVVPSKQSEPLRTDKQVDLPPTQPGDPAGGVFQTANDSTKNPGSSPLIAGDEVTSTGAPAGLILPDALPPLTGTQTLAGVYRTTSESGTSPFFKPSPVLLNDAGAVVQMPDVTFASLLPGNIFGNDGLSAWGAFRDTTGAVVHYTVGLPVNVDIAPMVATYVLASPSMATLPTDAQGNIVGSLIKWNQTVNFRSGQNPGVATWNLQGTLYNAQLNGSFDGTLNLSGPCAAQSCTVNAQGSAYGPGAQRFGVAYQLNIGATEGASMSAQGAAMLTKTSAQ